MAGQGFFRKLVVATALFATAPVFADDNSSSSSNDRPNAISAEILGRGLLYSFDYDRMLSDEFALGVGFSSWSVGASTSDGTTYAAASILIIPIYANWYFYKSGGNGWFLTAGVDILSASFDFGGSRTTGAGVAFTGGLGYEYRADFGLLFRANLYVLAAPGVASAWPGLSLGYAF